MDISIGSLGKDNSTGIVTGVVLDTATLTGTSNGLRIKTWQVSRYWYFVSLILHSSGKKYYERMSTTSYSGLIA